MKNQEFGITGVFFVLSPNPQINTFAFQFNLGERTESF